MGHALSTTFLPFYGSTDIKTGLSLYKVLHTQHRNTVCSLKIQPAGDLLAAADEVGCLLLFDLSSDGTGPLQSRQLLSQHGGISELCWIADDILAVGTTRGKIVVYSNRNEARRFHHVCDVEAHGDGVSQVAVESLDFSFARRCLVSVGEGRASIKLWNVDENGMLRNHPTGEQLPEYAVPRFVGFSENGAEIVVGYMEQAIVKHFSVEPWRLLQRKALVQHDSLCEGVDPVLRITDASRDRHYLGNAVLLPQAKRLAVFNLQNGFDIYSLPDFDQKCKARYPVDPFTSQGIALFRSATLLASPAKDGSISIFNSHDASLATVLRCPNRNQASFQAVDAMTIQNRNKEFLVGASAGKGRDTTITVWRRQVELVKHDNNLRNNDHSTSSTRSDSLIHHLIIGVFVYFLCSSIQPLIIKYGSLRAMEIPSTSVGCSLFGWDLCPVSEPAQTSPVVEVNLEVERRSVRPARQSHRKGRRPTKLPGKELIAMETSSH